MPKTKYNKILANDEILDDDDILGDGNHFDESEVPDGKRPSYRKYDVHEGIMFCVELSEQMFQQLPELNYKVQLLEILESLLELMSQLVITRPGTGVGCYIYNCHKDNSNNNIFNFIPLEDVNVKAMKKVNDLLDDLSNERTTLTKYFPYDKTQRTPLESLLELTQDELVKNVSTPKPFNNKKVFLFTDNDSPTEASDKAGKARLRRLFDDNNENFITFVPFFINRENKPFDSSFYSDIFKLGNSENPSSDYEIEFDGPSTRPISASYIKSRVLRKQEIKRVLFQCSLILNKEMNFTVAIKGYSIVSQEKVGSRYKMVYEHEDVRKEAFSKRKILNCITAEEVKEGLTKVFPYGDLNIELSEEDIKKVKEAYLEDGPFLKLLGFRSLEISLHYYNNITKPSFVVPDESKIDGSIRMLASLFRTMRKKNKVAVLWGKLKGNSHPGLWVLSASNASDPNEGFFLYRIPFLDEIRKFPVITTSSFKENAMNTIEYENIKRTTENIVGYFNLKHGYIPS
ncbi:hypothetical protein Kpol_1068p1, partial [Vanderwaltozyma polyspora DSM 70294]